jgi:indole-3-glycerol phosphate synthase
VSEADVCDARLMGADAVLLIVAALADDELVRLRGLAGELGLAALVEVHDEAELERALDAGADLVGVNQRDLTTFEVDQQRAERLAPRIPDGVVKVAESGVRDAADAARLARSGFDAVLVGESLVRASDREAAVRSLLGEGSPLAPLGAARTAGPGGRPGERVK